jgi:hypothetical protein
MQRPGQTFARAFVTGGITLTRTLVMFRDISRSICAAATPLHACIARLLLLSDILFNR